jgi:hypothetical protein
MTLAGSGHDVEREWAVDLEFNWLSSLLIGGNGQFCVSEWML